MKKNNRPIFEDNVEGFKCLIFASPKTSAGLLDCDSKSLTIFIKKSELKENTNFINLCMNFIKKKEEGKMTKLLQNREAYLMTFKLSYQEGEKE